MKSLLTVAILLLNSVVIFSQNYYNKIIPFEFGNPNPIEMVQFNNYYFIPTIYYYEPFDQSTIIQLNDSDQVQYHHYLDFVFATQSLTKIEDSLFTYAKDRNQYKALKLGKLGMDMDFDWVVDVPTFGTYNFPGPSISFGNSIYSAFFYKENDIKKIGVNRTDSDSSIIWTKHYEESGSGYSYPWDLQSSFDDYILLSYSISYYSEYEVKVFVRKLDSLGHVLWRSDEMDTADGGAAPVRITELSDSSILVTYRKDMSDVFEYACCYNSYTPTFVWLDKDGKILKENTFKIKYLDDLEFMDIKEGTGDYFFAFGQYKAWDSESNNYYGIITKYNNNGDTIWTHRYRHPDFNGNRVFHYVKDISELDNGDIVAMGSITPVGEETEIWLFKVNSEGCFGADECDELQIVDVNEVMIESEAIKLYPNPAHDRLTIETKQKFDHIQIYSLEGKLLKSTTFKNDLDIADLEKGSYLLRLIGEEGVGSEVFVKD